MVGILITGATGFVGRHLLKELLRLQDVTRIYVLVRDSNKFYDIFSTISLAHADKIHLMIGDITKKDLGLSNEDLIKISTISEVYHLAASISLSNNENAKRLIHETNVEGTKNLLELVKNSKSLTHFYSFTSAYACGMCNTPVKETWLNKPVGFRCYYEESKWKSENILKMYHENSNIPYVIIRPSIILDDLHTSANDVDTYSIYLFAKILKKIVSMSEHLDTNVRISGLMNSELNFIFVSHLIRMLIEIRSSKIKNKIFNLTTKSNISVQSLLDGITQGIASFNGRLLLCENLKPEIMTKTEKTVYDLTKPFIAYTSILNICWEIQNSQDIQTKIPSSSLSPDLIKEHIKNYVGSD